VWVAVSHSRIGRVGYRLPTEAEWEYACRANAETAWSFGGTDELLGEYAWFSQNEGNKTRQVGLLKPNILGLFDMHGNVKEWCQDWYGSYSDSAEIDPIGVEKAAGRVDRGGDWSSSARSCRAASRDWSPPINEYYYIGFRVVARQ
jgi:formylglycine-generating enzyme required for sulfatase activity